MIKIFDEETVAGYVNDCIYKELLDKLKVELFLVKYKEGEFISSPFKDEELFQIVVDGSLSIYFIRNDGNKYSLSSGTTNYIIGDMDCFEEHNKNIYAEASENVACIAFDMDKYREKLLNNADFMRFIAAGLSKKIGILTALEAEPASLSERVLFYMKYKCEGGILKGMEQAAFQLHCSTRQLQRVMNNYENDLIVKKIGKGTYKLIKSK